MPTTGAPLGPSPFGPGTPATGSAPPSLPMPTAVYIDPQTRSYRLDDATGELAAMPPVRQRWLLLLLTLRGSSATLPEDGVLLPWKMDDAFERTVQDAIRVASRQITEIDKVATLDGIEIVRVPTGRCVVTVSYTDLTTGLADGVTTQL